MNLALGFIHQETPNKESTQFMRPPDSRTESNSSEPGMTLETMISLGVLGWLAVGMVLMGFGIW